MTSVCEQFLRNPLINPRTLRSITLNGPVYNALVKECGYPNNPLVLLPTNIKINRFHADHFPNIKSSIIDTKSRIENIIENLYFLPDEIAKLISSYDYEFKGTLFLSFVVDTNSSWSKIFGLENNQIFYSNDIPKIWNTKTGNLVYSISEYNDNNEKLLFGKSNNIIYRGQMHISKNGIFISKMPKIELINNVSTRSTTEDIIVLWDSKTHKICIRNTVPIFSKFEILSDTDSSISLILFRESPSRLEILTYNKENFIENSINYEFNREIRYFKEILTFSNTKFIIYSNEIAIILEYKNDQINEILTYDNLDKRMQNVHIINVSETLLVIYGYKYTIFKDIYLFIIDVNKQQIINEIDIISNGTFDIIPVTDTEIIYFAAPSQSFKLNILTNERKYIKDLLIGHKRMSTAELYVKLPDRNILFIDYNGKKLILYDHIKNITMKFNLITKSKILDAIILKDGKVACLYETHIDIYQ